MTLRVPDPEIAAYDRLAPVYDRYTAGYDYEHYVGLLHELAVEHGLVGDRVLDVACGTGKAFGPLVRRGMRVTGCDASEGMISVARSRAPDGVHVFRADMRELPRLGPFDWVVCLDDAVNHLLTVSELADTFDGFRGLLVPGGLLSFDVNTLTAYRTAFATTWVYEDDGGHFTWQGLARPEADPGTICEAQVDAFRRSNGGWDRVTARHRQRHYPLDEVTALLAAAGFDRVACVGLRPTGETAARCDELVHHKAIVVARKRDESSRASERRNRRAANHQAPPAADVRGLDRQAVLTTGRESRGGATVPGSPGGLRIRPSVELFSHGDDLYVLKPSDDHEIVINDLTPSQHALIAALDGTGTADQIVADIAFRFDEPTTAVREAVDQLNELGIIENLAQEQRVRLNGVRARYEHQLEYFAELTSADQSSSELQAILQASRVTIIGLGGLGSWTAYALACAGIGELRLVDADTVEISNLSRQILYGEPDLGDSKAAAAARRLRSFNSDIAIRSIDRRLRGEAEVEVAIAGSDLVVGAADEPVHVFSHWLNAACFAAGIPYIAAGLIAPYARVGPMYVPGATGCLLCHEQAFRAADPLFDELMAYRRTRPPGGPAVGFGCAVIGGMIAGDAVHHLTGLAAPATLGAAWTFDLRTFASETDRVVADPDCPVCRRDPVSRHPSVQAN